MKKVLLTGMTGIHVAANRRRDYISFVYTLPMMLETLGYTVHHGTIDNFSYNKLSDYDLVLCGLSQWNSRISLYAYNALLASQHNNVIYYVDDWQLKNIQITDKILDRLFCDFMVETNKNINVTKIKIKKSIRNAAEDFQTKQINLLAPTFNWGNANLLLDKLVLPKQIVMHSIDPSPFINLKQIKSKNKLKHWVCSSLKDIRNSAFIKKQKLTWPIEFYYNKNYVSEHFLFSNVYATNWGILAQKYYHAGSGWWRMRFLHSVYSNSILLAHNDEIKSIGDAYEVEPFTIENMSHNELHNLASRQREQFNSHQLSKKDTLEKFKQILDSNK